MCASDVGFAGLLLLLLWHVGALLLQWFEGWVSLLVLLADVVVLKAATVSLLLLIGALLLWVGRWCTALLLLLIGTLLLQVGCRGLLLLTIADTR
jgi:hypothetical protein